MNHSRISEERKKLGLSQEELANKIGVSQKSISKYERGTRRPSYETLTLMASLFDVTVDYLLGNNQKNTEQPLPIKTASVSDTSIKYWVDKTGYAYNEVADKLGISEKQLLSYLNNEKDIPCKQLIALSEICDVSTDCLLGLTSKSRNRDFDNILPFRYNYNIAERIRKLCQVHNIDINSSYLENLLSLSDTEVFYLIEYGFVPHVDTITKLAKDFNVSIDYLLCAIDEKEEKALSTFQKLNEDNQDIIIGEMKKCLKEQHYEEAVAEAPSMKLAK